MAMEGLEKNCNSNNFWRVLIVDDDNFIHRMIKEINKNLRFEDRCIEFISSYNSDEAKEILINNNNIALVLIDIFFGGGKLRAKFSQVHKGGFKKL